jgi:CRP-like cAMP-binding protein
MYIQEGAVKLSVLTRGGKEAVVAMLGRGDFLGERALAGHPVCLEAATAMTATTVLIIPKRQMIRLLHDQHALSDRFIAYMLARNLRIEEDLVDQLFNSSEKRLARALLLLARYGKLDQTDRVLPRISQETLAEMVGTTRSGVNFFMNKFKKLGYRLQRRPQGQSFPPDRRRARLTCTAANHLRATSGKSSYFFSRVRTAIRAFNENRILVRRRIAVEATNNKRMPTTDGIRAARSCTRTW